MAKKHPIDTAATTVDNNTEQATPRPGFWRRYILTEAPYILLVLLGMIGIAYTDITVEGSIWFWKAMVPLFAGIIIIKEWHAFKDRNRHWELLRQQLLHWGSFMIIMQLVFLPIVQNNLQSTTTAQTLLLLLSLSSFLAGVYTNWRLCVVGIFLGVAVAVTAMMEQVILLMMMVTVGIIVLSIFWAKRLSARRLKKSRQQPSSA